MSEPTTEGLKTSVPTSGSEAITATETPSVDSALNRAFRALHLEAIQQGKTTEELDPSKAGKATLLLDGSVTLGDLKNAGFGSLASEIHPVTRVTPSNAGLGQSLKDIITASRTPQLLVGLDISYRPFPEAPTDTFDNYKGIVLRAFDEYPSQAKYPTPVLTVDSLQGKDGKTFDSMTTRGGSKVEDIARQNAAALDLSRFVDWAIAGKKGQVSFEQVSSDPVNITQATV